MEVISSGPVSGLLASRFSHVLNGYLGNGQPVPPFSASKEEAVVVAFRRHTLLPPDDQGGNSQALSPR